MDIVSLVSGGMDSYIGTLLLKETNPDDNIIPLYFNHKSKPSKMETELVKKQFGKDLIISNIFNFKTIENKETSEIHGRNLHFVAAASYYADKIALHGHKTSNFRDNTSKFRLNLTSVISLMLNRHVSVFSPIEHLTKENVLQTYIEDLNGDIEFILKTTTSCSEGKRFCGECWHCFSFYCCIWDYIQDLSNAPIYTNTYLIETYLTRAEHGAFDGKRTRIIKEIAKELL